MAFGHKQFFKNADRGDWQNATDAIQEGFDHAVVDSVQFDTTAAEVTAEAKMIWDDVDGTVTLGLKGGVVELNIGSDQLMRVYNATGTAFTKGQVVKLDTAQGQRLSVSLAQANNDANSSKTIGVVAEPIANNSEGWVMTSGHMHDLNTNALDEGELVWLSPTTAGGVTTTKPIAPDHLVLVGQCVKKAGGAGILFVHVQNGYELDELHNVLITNPQNGQVLKYESSTGLWKNANP